MPRPRRCFESNVVYHVYNRRTDKQCLFPEVVGYRDLLGVVCRANEKFAVRLHAYCFLYNHVHFALSAEKPGDLVKYVGWISSTHAIRFRTQTNTRGLGHVYQDRYKAKAAPDAVHYVTLIRYIERNPLEANVVGRAEEWQWSSLRERLSGRTSLITPGPWALPPDWADVVNSQDVTIAEIPSLLGQLSTFRQPANSFAQFE